MKIKNKSCFIHYLKVLHLYNNYSQIVVKIVRMMIKIYRNGNISQTSEMMQDINSKENRTINICIHRSKSIPQTEKLQTNGYSFSKSRYSSMEQSYCSFLPYIIEDCPFLVLTQIQLQFCVYHHYQILILLIQILSIVINRVLQGSCQNSCFECLIHRIKYY